MRRDRGIVWALLLATSGLVACGASGPPPERIVLVVIDTLRRDHLASYGGPVPTPRLDALAARGQVIPGAVASFHQTSMSMAALFTGRTPAFESERPAEPLPWQGTTWCGMARFGEAGDGMCLPASLPTLAERLAGAGFWTIGIASNQFLHEPSGFSRGFDDWTELGEKERAVGVARMRVEAAPPAVRWDQVNEAALAAVARRPRERFFLYVHYMDVHDYFYDAPGAAEYARAYRKRVAAVDVAVGRLLDALEADGLIEDAAIVVTADHGERLGERHPLQGTSGHLGNPSYQEVLDVPLIVAPALVPEPAGMVRTQDLFYLLQRVAGLDPEPAGELRDGELWIGEQRFRTYRSDRWKSVVRRSDGAVQLYDLVDDPEESRNVAGEHPDVVESHMQRIQDLTRLLSAEMPARRTLNEDERARLRALGYLN